MEEKDTKYARWLSGQLSEEEEKEMQSQGEDAELKAIIDAVDGWSLPAYDAEAAYQKFKTATTPSSTAKVRRLPVLRLVGIAAGILLLVGMFFLLQPSETLLTAERGSQLRYELPDGSVLTLNAGSEASFDADNWEEARAVQLKGEAWFQVEKGAKFTVQTQGGKVEVLGTEFNVRSRENRFAVACYEGRVAVERGDDRVVLSQAETVQESGTGLTEKQAVTAQVPSWQSGLIRFDNASLQEVFAEAERQFDVKIEIAAGVNGQFTGGFRIDNLEEALRQICLPQGLKFTLAPDGKSVKVKR